MVLGRGVQLHSGRVGPSVAVHHRLLPASPRRIQHPLPLLPDHRRPDAQHPAHCTHVVSGKMRQVLRQRAGFQYDANNKWGCSVDNTSNGTVIAGQMMYARDMVDVCGDIRRYLIYD